MTFYNGGERYLDIEWECAGEEGEHKVINLAAMSEEFSHSTPTFFAQKRKPFPEFLSHLDHVAMALFAACLLMERCYMAMAR